MNAQHNEGAASVALDLDDLERREREAFQALRCRVRDDAVLSRMWDRWQEARRAVVNARLETERT